MYSKSKGSFKKLYLLEKEMATHSSILARKYPWTEESGGLKSMGLHDWACVHEGGGRWVGSNKWVELKKKKEAIPAIMVVCVCWDYFLHPSYFLLLLMCLLSVK